ncbi:MAG: fluoride efflux transporter CrcB [Rikenellaceae bacterium]|jgi:CrcB protein|nr:fluoride efflux transporter CrcB [Rikenellaceae bacterium]
MLKTILLVGAGGAAGSVARYMTSCLMLFSGTLWGIFPWPTLTVNTLGSLFVGLLFACGIGSDAGLLAVTGFCGGFTTFSTFSLETVAMLRAGHISHAVAYMALSLLICLGATWLGWFIGEKIK